MSQGGTSRSPAVLTLSQRGQGCRRSRQNHFAPQLQTWYQLLVLTRRRSGMCPAFYCLTNFAPHFRHIVLKSVTAILGLYTVMFRGGVTKSTASLSEIPGGSHGVFVRSSNRIQTVSVCSENFYARGGHEQESFGKNVHRRRLSTSRSTADCQAMKMTTMTNGRAQSPP